MIKQVARALAGVVAVGLGLATAPAASQAQGSPASTQAATPLLTLDAALQRAERDAYANRIGAANAEVQGAQATAALRGILPSVRFEGAFMRTTDPIGAFGTTLRQRTIAQEDFDPRRLNYPSPTNNWVGSTIIEQPLLNFDAHLGRRAAARAGDAADASVEWTRAGTRVDVIRAYYGAVLAAEKVVTLSAAHEAALSHVKQAEQMVSAGLATRSDALLASVKAGEVETQLVEARGDAGLARKQLAVLLGAPGDTLFALPTSLPSAAAVSTLLSSDVTPAAERRADVTAARLGREAARSDVARTWSLYLPRLNGFARYDWNSPNSLYDGDKNWTVGVMASWSPFAGASEVAERQAAGGRADAARAGLEAARAQAAIEIEKAESDRQVALTRLEIAERGARQAAEAHRIVGKKYEGGLASVTDLLDAAATETQAELALSHARYAGIETAALRLRAYGDDPARIASAIQPEIMGLNR